MKIISMMLASVLDFDIQEFVGTKSSGLARLCKIMMKREVTGGNTCNVPGFSSNQGKKE